MNTNRNNARQAWLNGLPWVTIFIASIAVAAQWSETVTGALSLSWPGVIQGQWWRIVTGHFTHWTFDHLLWDVAAFVVLAAVCERRSRSQMVTCVLVSAVAISTAVAVWSPQFSEYRGLSGIDSALFAMVATQAWRDARASGRRGVGMLSAAALLALATKIAYELFSGDTLFVTAESSFVVLQMAHAAGGLVGLSVALAPRRSGPQRGASSGADQTSYIQDASLRRSPDSRLHS